MGQGVLARILAALPQPSDPRVMVGTSLADDGGIFRLDADRALVATLDFFTPIVDDPYTYGAIAAANSLSDVYAMGGEPLYALAIAAFPDNPKVLPMLADVMAGAVDKAKEAGICIIGGHTIKDKEPKFGLSVTGSVPPDRVWDNRGAGAGDHIVLTKPIGTGVATTAIKWKIASKETENAVIESMSRLNAGAARAGREARIHTATDVTGYGLTGHLIEVLEGSGLCAEIRHSEIPVFPGVRELLRRRIRPALADLPHIPGAQWVHRRFGIPPVPGGTRDNLSFQRAKVRFPPLFPEEEVCILADPQTSGGLLLFVPEDRADPLRKALADAGEKAWWIGRTHPMAAPSQPRLTVV
ncbi:MAG: selenide, water dikinase SelD [Deltaproteobacteria bacterium]|nr:selenide, water dikinase SelD [Deltaproteobacteria bacterium]